MWSLDNQVCAIPNKLEFVRILLADLKFGVLTNFTGKMKIDGQFEVGWFGCVNPNKLKLIKDLEFWYTCMCQPKKLNENWWET